MAPLRLALAVVTLGGAYLACLVVVRALRRRPTALAAPLAMALLVGVEALLLHALSRVRAVELGPVLVAHAAIIAAGAAFACRVPGALPRGPRLSRPSGSAGVLLGALFVLVATSAIAYRPNNWDSMTYHLARVAHWIQHRSVEAYPTSIWRQNLLTPGAEYLILVLQLVSGSDRLDNLVQLSSWVAVVAAVVPLARLFGARRGVARAGAVVVGAAPMLVLQASSTQNDLVAAAMVAAVAAGCVPLLHRRRRWRWSDLLLLLAALAGGVLVKTPGLLFVAPLLAAAAIGWARSVGGRGGVVETGPALVVALLVAAPLAGVATAGTPITRAYVYEGLATPADRLLNATRGVLRNLPYWERAGDLVAPPRTEGCPRLGGLCLATNRMPHEDAAGNPALAALGLAVLGVAAMRWRRLRPAVRLGVVSLPVGWLLFHAMLRDNAWITRLQVPGVVVLAAALGALPPLRGAWRWAMAALVAVAFAHGAWAAQRDLRRPLVVAELRRGGATATYYHGGPEGVAAQHDAVLERLGRSRCRRLGLFIGGDSYDYPLTWRAMQLGIEVRHLVEPGDWPCAVFSDLGPPPARPDGSPWSTTETAGYYLAAGVVEAGMR